MKKEFEFEETVKYIHRIEVEVPDGAEEGFEDIAQEVAQKIENEPMSYDKYDVATRFREIYGDSNVEFFEDGSPNVGYEAL